MGRRGREEKDHTGHCKPQWFFAWVRARGLPGRSKGNSQEFSSERDTPEVTGIEPCELRFLPLG